MARSIAKAYTNAVKKNQKVLYGVWEPGFPVALGDFGVMEGNIFVRLGHIGEFEELQDFGIDVRIDPTKDEKTFISEHGVRFELKPAFKGTIEGVEVNASMDVVFSESGAVFFNAAGCRFEMVENKFELGQRLLALHKQDRKRWRKEYVVVTDLVRADRSLILVSESSDFAISLEAQANVPMINLAEASLRLDVKAQQSNGYQMIANDGQVLLIGLGKIKSPFLWFGEKFRPLAQKYTAGMLHGIENAEQVKTDAGDDSLAFSQFTDDLDE